MGVANFMRLVQRHAPAALGDAHIGEWRGRRLALDANIYVYKSMAARPLFDGRHVVRMLRLAHWFRRRDIECVFVFDGQRPLVAKQSELAARRERKRRVVTRYNDVRRGLALLQRVRARWRHVAQLTALCAAAAAAADDGDALQHALQQLFERAECVFLPQSLARTLAQQWRDAASSQPWLPPPASSAGALLSADALLRRVALVKDDAAWIAVHLQSPAHHHLDAVRLFVERACCAARAARALHAHDTTVLAIHVAHAHLADNTLASAVDATWQCILRSDPRAGGPRVLPLLFAAVGGGNDQRGDCPATVRCCAPTRRALFHQMDTRLMLAQALCSTSDVDGTAARADSTAVAACDNDEKSIGACSSHGRRALLLHSLTASTAPDDVDEQQRPVPSANNASSLDHSVGHGDSGDEFLMQHSYCGHDAPSEIENACACDNDGVDNDASGAIGGDACHRNLLQRIALHTRRTQRACAASGASGANVEQHATLLLDDVCAQLEAQVRLSGATRVDSATLEWLLAHRAAATAAGAAGGESCAAAMTPRLPLLEGPALPVPPACQQMGVVTCLDDALAPADARLPPSPTVDDALERLNQSAVSLETQTVRVHYDQVNEVKRALQLAGECVVDAPHEAEAACVRLCLAGRVDAVMSDDTDAVAFGANCVLRLCTFDDNARAGDAFAQQLDCAALRRALGVNNAQLVDMCLLAGCDFLPGGVRGVGPVRAWRLVSRHGTLERALEHVPARAAAPLRQAADEIERARRLFNDNRAPPFDDVQSQAQRPTPDLPALRAFLAERNWLARAEQYLCTPTPAGRVLAAEKGNKAPHTRDTRRRPLRTGGRGNDGDGDNNNICSDRGGGQSLATSDDEL